MLKRYFLLDGYFDRNKNYWFSLYPWHIGFYLIVMFHGMAFLGALIIATTDISVSGGSSNILGVLVYYGTIIIAVSSFVLGSLGSIGLLIQRLTNRGLRAFASPQNYFNYIFFLAMFMSGFIAWIGFDPTFVHYRHFWEGLITIDYTTVESATYVHIILFAVFLIYLPFTRSTHYIVVLLAYFGVLWNDKPNLVGGELEKDIGEQLNKKVSWTASHIQTGKMWVEVATTNPTEGADKA
jgi:nitrate reductase gamma subunit